MIFPRTTAFQRTTDGISRPLERQQWPITRQPCKPYQGPLGWPKLTVGFLMLSGGNAPADNADMSSYNNALSMWFSGPCPRTPDHAPGDEVAQRRVEVESEQADAAGES